VSCNICEQLSHSHDSKTDYVSNGRTSFNCQCVAEFDAEHLVFQRLIPRNGLKTPYPQQFVGGFLQTVLSKAPDQCAVSAAVLSGASDKNLPFIGTYPSAVEWRLITPTTSGGLRTLITGCCNRTFVDSPRCPVAVNLTIADKPSTWICKRWAMRIYSRLRVRLVSQARDHSEFRQADFFDM
jgi:hypothetical protein